MEENGLKLEARFAYPDSEFLASTDERFRPVSLAMGPDGAIYIADMYRGLIQHGAYITEYLREQTRVRELEEPIHLGRIWRVVPESGQLPEANLFSDASVVNLVDGLMHSNGWHRDTAQRLLVEQNNSASLPLLQEVLYEGSDYRGRLHALWTLEGMGIQNPALYFDALADKHPTVQAHALRVLEGIASRDEPVMSRLAYELDGFINSVHPELALQAVLTAGILPSKESIPLFAEVLQQYADQPIVRDAVLSGVSGKEMDMMRALWDLPEWQAESGAPSIFMEMLATTIVRKEKSEEVEGMLALLDTKSTSTDWRSKVLHFSTNPQVEMDGEIRDIYMDGRQRYLTGCAGCHGQEGEGLPRFAPSLGRFRVGIG